MMKNILSPVLGLFLTAFLAINEPVCIAQEYSRTFVGYLEPTTVTFLDTSGDFTWRVTHYGHLTIKLFINGQSITGEARVEDGTQEWQGCINDDECGEVWISHPCMGCEIPLTFSGKSMQGEVLCVYQPLMFIGELNEDMDRIIGVFSISHTIFDGYELDIPIILESVNNKPTGIKVYVTGDATTYVVYGGDIAPIDDDSAYEIGFHPEENGYHFLGSANSTHEFYGSYFYYLVRPSETNYGPLQVDAFELLGASDCFWDPIGCNGPDDPFWYSYNFFDPPCDEWPIFGDCPLNCQGPPDGDYSCLWGFSIITGTICEEPLDIVVVPYVINMLEVDARSALEADGLVIDEVTLGCDTVEFNHVMGQNPIAGTEVALGSSVDLVISGASVPDVLAMSEADAEAFLNTSNLVKGKVTREWSNTVPVGHIISQSPNPGTIVECNSAVDLVISKGPKGGGGGGGGMLGPIVYWSFDNPSNPGHDDSDHGHQLTIPGPWTSVPGPVGDAIALEDYGGINSGPDPWGPYTSTSGMDYPGISGFTVAFWAKIADSKTAYVQDYWQNTDYGETFNLGYQGSGEGITFMVRHDFSNSTPVLQVSSTPYIGQWIHLAGCYESKGRKVKLYINGRLEGSATLSAGMRTSLPPYLYVNGNWDSTNPGSIDEVRIYNLALKISEIKKLAK